jgi:prepilin-type N-terminal cleavage/methylation domain-containing protein
MDKMEKNHHSCVILAKMILAAKNHCGFTLLEVVIALFLFLVTVVGLASVTVSVIRGNDLSQQLKGATNLAQDKIEDLKRKGYDHAEMEQDTHQDTGNPISAIYNRTWTVKEDTPIEGVKTVTVKVEWNVRGLRNVEVVTFLTR